MSEILRLPRVEPSAIRPAVEAAVEYLWRTQGADGRWETFNDVGPVSTAQVVVTLHYAGRLDAADARDAARWLIGQQRGDGSWIGYPYAKEGDLCTTASAWAALHVAGIPDDHAAVRAAGRYIDGCGGLAEIVARMPQGDYSAVILAMAGLLDPQRLPVVPLTYCLVEPLREALLRRIHGGLLTFSLEMAILARRLRGDWGPDGRQKSAADEEACRYCLSLLDEFQNAEGSWWNGLTHWSGLIVATLHAMALPESDDRITRALPAIHRFRVRDAGGTCWMLFGDGVWATSFNVRALLTAGVSVDHPNLVRATDWLVESQITHPQSAYNNRQTDVPRTGAWSFQRENEKLPDLDDSAVAISAVGMAANATRDPERAAKLRRCARRGLDWVDCMQNRDGGWASYLWDMPEKPVGPVLGSYPAVDTANPVGMMSMMLEPPAAEIGDPSFEDIVGRVLHGLGQNGYTTNDVAVQKALEFLRMHQFADGPWFGRWINYVVATAFVLIGTRAVGVSEREDWLQKALAWLLGKQNADGGWGETHESYRHPERAGLAPSMPAVTGVVVVSLVAMGLREHPAVVRATQYLLDQQRPDGSWNHNDFLHTFNPPDTFYVLQDATHFWPLEALGCVLNADAPPHIDPPAPRRDEVLDAMRQHGDPVADAAAANLGGDAPDWPALVASLGRAADLPPPVAEYFAATAALPAWADAEQIRRGQALFARHGWEVSLALFYSALPQGYAIGPCARTMRQTRSLTEAARRRIFETAQFLFDVLDEGGLAPGGRGVRACQTIRLLHAVLRRRLAGAVPEADGVPISQEDELGTLLLFSVSTLDALRKIGVTVGAADAEAWVHTWAVVGHLLGVDERLLPRSVAEAEVGLMAVRRRHWEATPEGRALGAALVGLLAEYYPPQLAQVPLAMVRHFAGSRCAELLGLPAVDWERLALDGSTWAFGLWASGDLAARFNGLVGQFVQKALGGVMMMQAQGQFDWAKLMLEASRAAGFIPAGNASPLRALAFWAMKAVVQAERGGPSLRLPAALNAHSTA